MQKLVSASLLISFVDVVLRLEPFYQVRHIGLLLIGRTCQGKLHFFGGVVVVTLRAVNASQSGMHEPLIRMLLCVRTENRVGLLGMFFRLQLASINVDLDWSCHGERFVERCFGLIRLSQRSQDLRLGDQVIETFFHLDGLIGILQRFIEVALVREQIIRRVVPAFPCVLRKTAKLLVQALRDHFVHIDRDLEGNGYLLPPQGNRAGIGSGIVEIVGQGFVKIRGLEVSR